MQFISARKNQNHRSEESIARCQPKLDRLKTIYLGILDIIGLNTAYNVAMLNPAAKDPTSVQGKIAGALKEKIDQGKTGVNAGEGFYKYK